MPKVTRLTLYPKEGQTPGESVDVSKKRSKRWIPTREKPHLKAKKLPYYRDLPPKYEPAHEPNPHSHEQTPVHPVHQPAPSQPAQVNPGADAAGPVLLGLFLGFILIVVIIVGALPPDSNDGPGVSRAPCPTSCNAKAVMIPPHCSCPAGSRFYNSINDGGQFQGYKQCVC